MVLMYNFDVFYFFSICVKMYLNFKTDNVEKLKHFFLILQFVYIIISYDNNECFYVLKCIFILKVQILFENLMCFLFFVTVVAAMKNRWRGCGGLNHSTRDGANLL